MINLEFSPQEAYEIICDDNEEFVFVRSQIIGRSRWAIMYEMIVQNTHTMKFYRTYYSVGATENQDHVLYQYDDPIFIEVKPYEQIVVAYREA